VNIHIEINVFRTRVQFSSSAELLMAFLLIGLSRQVAKINNSSLRPITTHSTRNLGFIFDEHLTFSDQISVSNLAIIIFVSFAVSVHTSIPK